MKIELRPVKAEDRLCVQQSFYGRKGVNADAKVSMGKGMSNKSFIVIERLGNGYCIVLKNLSGKQVKSKQIFDNISQAAQKALDYRNLCCSAPASEVCCVMF